MKGLMLAKFTGPDALCKAAREASDAGYRAVDAFTPFPVEGLAEAISAKPTRVRLAMLAAGILLAGLAYFTEWYTGAINYPINSGGRAFDAWPAFMLFPFAVGVLGAAVGGLIVLFLESGLPRLNHMLFDVDGFERVTQDAFLLAVEPPLAESELPRARAWLHRAGAIAIWEIRT